MDRVASGQTLDQVGRENVTNYVTGAEGGIRAAPDWEFYGGTVNLEMYGEPVQQYLGTNAACSGLPMYAYCVVAVTFDGRLSAPSQAHYFRTCRINDVEPGHSSRDALERE